MVNEEKLRDMRGDELRKMNQNGMLPLIYAHLFSLQLMRDVFARQVSAGKMPQVTEAPSVQIWTLELAGFIRWTEPGHHVW